MRMPRSDPELCQLAAVLPGTVTPGTEVARTVLERPGVNCRLKRPRLPALFCLEALGCRGWGKPPLPAAGIHRMTAPESYAA